jgi:hypothetical protein
MKAITTLLLFVILACTNGCMSYVALDKAGGYTGKWVTPTKEDSVFKRKDGSPTYYVDRRKNPKGTPQDPPPPVGLAYEPKPAYYLLTPFTVVGDIATFPIQLLIAFAYNGH